MSPMPPRAARNGSIGLFVGNSGRRFGSAQLLDRVIDECPELQHHLSARWKVDVEARNGWKEWLENGHQGTGIDIALDHRPDFVSKSQSLMRRSNFRLRLIESQFASHRQVNIRTLDDETPVIELASGRAPEVDALVVFEIVRSFGRARAFQVVWRSDNSHL